MQAEPHIRVPEAEIIAGIIARDDRALYRMYEYYSAALYGAIFKLIAEENQAQEVLQETFVRVWQNAHTYDSKKGRLYTWSLNIARNLAIDKLRSADFKAQAKTTSLDNSVNKINKEYSVDFDAELLDMRGLVERLRPEQKELLDLIYFNGYTQAEAAQKLKIPLGTVKTRVRAAVNELRKLFRV